MAKKDRYLFNYTWTMINLGPRPNSEIKGSEKFKTLAEVRDYAYVSPGRFGQVMSRYDGYIYDLKTGKIVGAIDSGRYVYKQDGNLYCRYINKGGVLDSYYGKMKYRGELKF